MRSTIAIALASAVTLVACAPTTPKAVAPPADMEKVFTTPEGGYTIVTSVAQVTGAEAVAMIDCANRVADARAPLTPADLALAGQGFRTVAGEVVYDSRHDSMGRSERADIIWQNYTEASSEDERARFLAQFQSFNANRNIDGLTVDLTATHHYDAAGVLVHTALELDASTSEGARAPKTYGDKQYWSALHLVLDSKTGAVTFVRQLDQSIGFSGNYQRQSGDPRYTYSSIDGVEKYTLVEGNQPVDRAMVGQCFVKPIAAAVSQLRS